MSGEHLSQTDVIRLAIAAAAAKLHVAFPARVERVAGGRVDVRPEIGRATECRDGSTLHEELPVIASVPIVFPREAYLGVVFPVSVGSYVLVVCCDRNIGEWLRTGRREQIADVGTHVLDGAVAIPGLFPDASAVDPEHMILGSLGSGPSIHMDDDEVRLGGDGATQRVPHGDAWVDAIATFRTALSTWADAVDAGVTAAGGTVAGHAAFVTAIGDLGTALETALSERVRVT